MIQIDVTSILSMIAGSISRMFGMDLLRWLAWKALIITVLTVTLPIVLKNLITWLYETVMSVATSQLSASGLHSAAFEFTGFSGYLAYHLMIPESIAVILTGLAIRFALNFIPFVG